MDLPILKYVDIVIGLGVVILLVCTIVAAITQVLLSVAFVRARNLRNALKDLIEQIDPDALADHAEYIAERCLRHPLVARDNTILGLGTTGVRNYVRCLREWKLPLPPLNPSTVIQRDELILMLVEWAADEGALAHWDKRPDKAQYDGRLAAVRSALCEALRKAGIADPKSAVWSIRAEIVRQESEHPTQPSSHSRTTAIIAAAPSDFVAKIHVWFDNSMARITSHLGLQAKALAAVVALVLVFGFQFDAINLIARLSSDDRLRAELVREAEVQTTRIEQAIDAQKAPENAAQQATDREAAQREIDAATVQRAQVEASLAVLRDPNRAIMPSYFLLQKVSQALVCKITASEQGTASLTLSVGADERTLRVAWRDGRFLDELATAIQSSGAPVAVYTGESYQRLSCLRLVARDAQAENIDVSPARGTSSINLAVSHTKGIDHAGLSRRWKGMLLAWILVSLGAPFWYDLIKKLLGLRSLLAKKDDEDRQQRQGQSPPGSVPGQASVNAPASGGSEQGDLSATGAQG